MVAAPEKKFPAAISRLCLSLLLFGCIFLSADCVSAKETGDYKLGDKISEDIFTLVPLAVVDPVATEALKQKEAARIPVILRFDPTVADKAETEIRNLFASNRSNFLSAIKLSFRRAKLTDADIASPKFQRQVAAFKRQNRAFPLTTNLAELWARGDSGRVVQADLIARVRETLSRPVRLLTPADEVKVGNTVRLVTVSRPDEVLTLDAADQRGMNISRTNLTTLARARTNLIARFPSEQQALGKFAAARLRANTFVELELTRQDRARRTDSLLSVNNYEAGQIIARAGQVVDKKILAALDQLREKTAPVRLQEQITVQQTQAAQFQRRSQWLIAGLGLIAVCAVAIAWALARRKRPASLLPVRVGAVDARVALPSRDETMNREAQAGMFAQLALVFRGLLRQRSQLLDAQQSAIAEMTELTQRLEKLQAPLQDRLRAYETRIAELEKALAAKGDENRELIKAKIQLIRRQLEAERSRNRLVLN
jgi:hypothetical protein